MNYFGIGVWRIVMPDNNPKPKMSKTNETQNDLSKGCGDMRDTNPDPELKPKMFWDEWRFNRDNNRPVFFIKHLVNLFGCRVDIHKMVSADDQECFHTHPAHAIRIILWGGYWDENLEESTGVHRLKKWRPFRIGWVKPDFNHRIDLLCNGKVSYSLWIRFRKTHEIKLVGPGWDTQAKGEPNDK